MDKSSAKRDYLARDRTQLANERTLLAYWRTALAFLVLGFFLIRFIPERNFIVISSVSILFGAIMFIYGIVRYSRYRAKIKSRQIYSFI